MSEPKIATYYNILYVFTYILFNNAAVDKICTISL